MAANLKREGRAHSLWTNPAIGRYRGAPEAHRDPRHAGQEDLPQPGSSRDWQIRAIPQSPGGLGGTTCSRGSFRGDRRPQCLCPREVPGGLHRQQLRHDFKGELRIDEGADGNDGQQYATDIGPIDILAVEPKSKSFIVIELKKGRPSDQVIGQILRYMGWVKKICTSGQAVKGLVICRDPDPKLSYALEMTNNIDVRYYSVSFKLREARAQLAL